MRVKSCKCGAKKKDIQCGKSFTCDTKCKKLRDCKRHPCNRKCCTGCQQCEQPCSKTLNCKNHKCTSRCHTGKYNYFIEYFTFNLFCNFYQEVATLVNCIRRYHATVARLLTLCPVVERRLPSLQSVRGFVRFLPTVIMDHLPTCTIVTLVHVQSAEKLVLKLSPVVIFVKQFVMKMSRQKWRTRVVPPCHGR